MIERFAVCKERSEEVKRGRDRQRERERERERERGREDGESRIEREMK